MNPTSTVTAPFPQTDCQSAVTLSEYAAATGQSVRTVREKVRRGQLPAELVKGRHGMEYRVYLQGDRHPDSTLTGTVLADYPQTDSHPTGTVTAPSPHPDSNLPELVTLIERRQQTILELAGRCGFLQARVQALEGEVLALKAPASTYHPAEVESGPHSAVHAAGSVPNGAERPLERENSPVTGEMTHKLPSQQNGAERRPWWRFW